MKKKFKCPVCGEETISIKEKRKLSYRYKSDLWCSNCGNKLRISRTSIILIGGYGVLGAFFVIQDISSSIKTIFLILLTILLYFCLIYVMPIVKDDD